VLLAGARALLFPSLYEGFGLPVVEAMKCGTAVMTSANSAMSEISGGAALLAKALETDDICEKILQLHNDMDLVNSLELRGLALSEKFSWEQCAQETVRLYKSM
jgi:alpha-1,3-rhamnosyl/mannosyltransferase